MSANNAIMVEGLSKRYSIGHLNRPDTVRDALSNGLSGLLKSIRKRRAVQESFWALKDISFSVAEGEVMGVIGRNGAGKSTLLKLLSRITEPSSGRMTLRGRVASLLEVGTGFHPELSGRENIFLNGAILGMSRAEIRLKFDEIVAFAEVERFLDTPVKRYSSGMYVRLAFAVAAHLEPEILIIDEVLAVGDTEFQRKCLGKMDTVSKSGRTVLFVSHNLEALRAICATGLLLESGRVIASDTIDNTIARYSTPQSSLSARFEPRADKPTITGINVDQSRLAQGDLVINVHYQSPFPLRPAIAGVILSTIDGRPLFGTNMRTHPPLGPRSENAAGTCTLNIPGLRFHSGTYSLSVWLGDTAQDYDAKHDAVSFEFISPNHYPSRPPIQVIGPVDLPCSWEQSS